MTSALNLINKFLEGKTRFYNSDWTIWQNNYRKAGKHFPGFYI